MGFYLYCLRRASSWTLSFKGFDGKDVFIFPYKDLQAIVSEVSLKKFGADAIKFKAQNDLAWISVNARLHEKVIEKVMRDGAVIPMKFGIVFKNKKSLERSLSKNYGRFKKLLAKLEGNKEWGVKVYVDKKIFGQDFKRGKAKLSVKNEGRGSVSEGMAYFLEKQKEKEISAEIERVLLKFGEDFFKSLKEYAQDSAKGKILDKAFTGESGQMILNSFFLVRDDNIEDFKRKIKSMIKEYGALGFRFRYTGPWPSYHFV